MKIGIYDPYLDTLGGGERYMLSAAKCLSSQHKVSVFWNPSDKKNINARSKEKFGLNLEKIVFTTNIFDRNTPLISRVLLAKKYDRIIFLSDGSLPFVLTKNLIIHFQFPVQWVNENALKRRLKFLHVRKIICNSLFTKAYIDDKFLINSVVLYPPIDMVSGNKVKKENIIMTVGRFGNNSRGSSFKKQDVMIEMFEQMLKQGVKNWKFVLVVSTRPQDNSALLALKKKAENFPIEFLENPDVASLRELYARSKIYWHAAGQGEDLENFPERAEHFGISTVEAMSAGAVPVVIKGGGQIEIVSEGRDGYLWSTTNECIDKTISLIGDENMRQAFSFMAARKAQLFSTSRFCREISAIIT